MSDWRIRRKVCAALAGLSAIALAGCTAGGGVLTAEETPRYAGMTPFDFVRVRFYDQARNEVMEAIDRAARAYGEGVDRMQGRTVRPPPKALHKPELAADASLVTWPAHFTDVNYVQLVRPAADLKRFCESRGGQWRSLDRYTGDPVAAMRQNPIAVFLDAHARVTRHLTARGAYVGFEEMRDVIASDVGAEMAGEAAQNNRMVDSLFSVEGFRFAQRLDAIGLFECVQGEGKTWWASILPATVVGRDPSNQLSSSMARLAIRVYAAKPKTR